MQVDNNKYRVYPKGGPLFYKKSDGTYGDIDHTFNDTTSTIGDISLMDKGVVSVGKRKGNNPHKVVGIRPDNNQHLGTQQLEFSLVNVELDGESQEFNVEDDLEIQLRASKVFQLVKINKDFKDFKIEFDIYAKNLPLQNNKYTEETTIRDYGCTFTNLGEQNGADIVNNSGTDVRDEDFIIDKAIPHMDFYIGKMIDEHITLGQYSLEEEFTDTTLEGYTTSQLYTKGTSMYFKDAIVGYIKCQNIDAFEEILVNNICRLFELETLQEPDKFGQYFVKDGKKVGGYYAGNSLTQDSQSKLQIFFNTAEIPQRVKDLFIRETFNDVGYIDIGLDDFISKLKECFDVDLQLTLDTTYYEPTNDKFEFKVNKESFYIGLPIVFDNDYNALNLKTTHTLKDNADGSYRYTKYFDMNGYFNNENNIKYIDATLYVAEVEDIFALYSTGLSSGIKKNVTNFNNWRNSGTGSAAGIEVNRDYNIQLCGDTGIKSSGKAGTSYGWNYYQKHYTFDSSGIEDTVSDLTLNNTAAYTTVGGSHSDISVILLKSTSTSSNVKENWNEFTGFTSSWDDGDVTEYSSEFVVDGYEKSHLTNTTNYVLETIPLNAGAMTDIEDDNTFKCAIIDYDQYYLNSLDTSYGANATGQRIMYGCQIDNTDSALRPYLECTTGVVSVTYNATFFGTNF